MNSIPFSCRSFYFLLTPSSFTKRSLLQKGLSKLTCLLILFLYAASLTIGLFIWQARQPLKLPDAEIEVFIEPGLSARGVVQNLQANGIPVNSAYFILLARLSGQAHKIKAGNYAFTDGLTTWQLLQKLARGDTNQHEIRFIEGWTFRRIRQTLNQHSNLRHDTLHMSDVEILKRVKDSNDFFVYATSQPEGLFYPDTYLFSGQVSDLSILRRAYLIQQQHLKRIWAQRPSSSPLNSPYEALILASIIEKETGRTSDRGQIAGVFSNRLRKGMLLQTDPSVIYGLGEQFDGNLRKRDLLSDTPYNTYTRAGLPPTPIAMPSLEALRAAILPDPTEALYFVARGDGTSQFSRSLEEHNRAVAQYQRNLSANSKTNPK